MSNTNTTASNAAPEKNDAMPLKLDVRVRPITPKENLVGFAAITINDCFVVEGLKVCASEKGLYVNMPSQQDGNGNWRDICKPITADFRKQLNEAVAEGYEMCIRDRSTCPELLQLNTRRSHSGTPSRKSEKGLLLFFCPK